MVERREPWESSDVFMQAIATSIHPVIGETSSELQKRIVDLEGQVAAIHRVQAVIEFDLEGNILLANDNFLAMMGYDRSEVVGKHHSMFVEEGYRGSPEYTAFWDALRAGEYQSSEFKRRSKSGREVWIQASYNPILDRSGKPFKVVKYATDVTKKKVASLNLAETAKKLTEASTTLSTVGNDLRGSATSTVERASSAASVAEQVSADVNSVAAASEQMTTSIDEIAQSVTKAAMVATDGVQAAKETNDIVLKLAESSVEIGQVIKIISSVAQQTNLLALNATIEAARAGEAGKGFAVVANEVKELAKETAKATEEIARKVEAIQSDSGSATKAIERISEIIQTLDTTQHSVASAIEEQSVTTQSIAENVVRAALGAAEITASAQAVTQGAKGTMDSAHAASDAGSSLAQLAKDLEELTRSI